MNDSFKGTTALVTGAGLGLGRATARAFAGFGANVVVNDIDEARGKQTVDMIKSNGGEAVFIQADVSRADQVEAMVNSAVKKYGRLDYAHNNVGILDGASVTETTEAQWDKVIDTNLKGIWLCMKYELIQMSKQKSGIIVNTSSVAGLIGAPDSSLYAASKWGVIGLTRSAALEYARTNIRINAVCPAGMEGTGMYNQTLAANPEMTVKLRDGVPMGRDSNPEEIAQAVIWLCSDAASYITGCALPVDGGRSAV